MTENDKSLALGKAVSEKAVSERVTSERAVSERVIAEKAVRDENNLAREISIVCKCKAIPYRTIRKAIQSGAITIEKIRIQTKANTGCGKSCTEKILRMIEKYRPDNN